MDRDFFYFLLFLNVILSVRYYLKSKCEVPLFIAVFNLFVEWRIVSLKMGYGGWVAYNYGIDFKFNFEQAAIVSNLVILGSTVMIYSFMLFYKPKKNKVEDSNNLLNRFIIKNKTFILVGLVIFSIVQALLRNSSDTGAYGFLATLGNTSFIILLFLLFMFTPMQQLIPKLIYLGLLLFLAYLTFGAALRFQFLGWIIPVGFFLVRNIKPKLKLVYMTVGVFGILIIFSLVRGVAYHPADGDTKLNNSDLFDLALDRMLVADDVNFIDGFMMVYQVYPRYLDFQYGFQHVEIFLRPIPRGLWANKPVGSWVRNYQKKYNGEVLNSAGFSPTIWGVFYSEMGVFGVVFFSVLWAWLISYLYAAFSAFKSDMSFILMGVLLCCMVPVFRSGDMAGDFAIVLMSFWPLIVFIRRYKKFLKNEFRLQQRLNLRAA